MILAPVTPLAVGQREVDDAPTAASVVARRSSAPATEWDGFAQRCQASFRCSHRGSRAWQFAHHFFHRMCRLDLCVDGTRGPIKVGQCAVGIGRRRSVFSDGLHLLPEHAHLWSSAMSAALARLGPATYLYGSPWSLEVPRETALSRLAGVRVDGVESTTVDAIDFSRWATFDGYRRAVSENVRRNAKKAAVNYPGLVIVEGGGGIGGARRYLASVGLRRAMFRRKGLDRSTLLMAIRSAARLWSVGRHGRLAYLTDGGELLAFHMGIGFGRDWSYLEGAARPDAVGVSWNLHMRLAERVYEQSGGRGRFVMGSDDGSQSGEAWDGLRRSRLQCCATPFPTSVVTFTYARP